MPERIQLSRRKGWRLPENAVSVARPGRWGNPFTVDAAIEAGFARTRDDAVAVVVACFRSWMTRGPQSEWWFDAGKERFITMQSELTNLAGRDLACWCPVGRPCHGDVLLELANRRNP